MTLTPTERDRLYDSITPHLAAVARLFKSPKITLVVRAPDLSDGDVVLTDDDLKSVIASLEKTCTHERHVVKAIREKAASHV